MRRLPGFGCFAFADSDIRHIPRLNKERVNCRTRIINDDLIEQSFVSWAVQCLYYSANYLMITSFIVTFFSCGSTKLIQVISFSILSPLTVDTLHVPLFKIYRFVETNVLKVTVMIMEFM